jgi:Lon protease-like protein
MPMQIPLFPLHTVLAPGIALPLHVFEERYRLMVRRCLDDSAPFGVVLIREGSEVAPRDGTTQELAIAGVGTFAEIREANAYADGRWDLLVVGTSRFVVREVRPDVEPYLVAEVDPYPDEPGECDPEEADALAGRVTRRFVDYLRLLQPRDGESADPIDVQMEVETEVDEDDVDGADDEGDDEDDDGPALRDAGDLPFIEMEAEPVPVDNPDAVRAALRIPDDPSALSYLLTGIVQVEQDRKQALLEAGSAEERLRDIDVLLDRELMLLGARLAPFAIDRRGLAGSAN